MRQGGDARGSAADRRRRKVWLLSTFENKCFHEFATLHWHKLCGVEVEQTLRGKLGERCLGIGGIALYTDSKRLGGYLKFDPMELELR